MMIQGGVRLGPAFATIIRILRAWLKSSGARFNHIAAGCASCEAL